MKIEFLDVRTDDSDSFDSSIRNVVLGGSVALDTFILSEAHDRSGGRFRAGLLLAPAEYGCAHAYLFHHFFFIFSEK